MRRVLRCTAIVAVALAISCTQKSSPFRVTTTRLASHDVEVRFHGLVAHVFGRTIGERDRSVVLHDKNGHHPLFLIVPEEIDDKTLATVLGVTLPTPSGGTYTIPLKTPVSVRVVGWDRAGSAMASVMAPALKSDKSFDELAPHLVEVGKKKLVAGVLKPSLFDRTPDGSDWILFFNLDGGMLAAEKACVPSEFAKEKKSRDFAATVILNGSVTGEPALQVMKAGGKWETVLFKQGLVPNLAEFGIHAAAAGGGIGKSHFGMFKTLADPPPADADFDDIVFVKCPDKKGIDPACTNNQWP